MDISGGSHYSAYQWLSSKAEHPEQGRWMLSCLRWLCPTYMQHHYPHITTCPGGCNAHRASGRGKIGSVFWWGSSRSRRCWNGNIALTIFVKDDLPQVMLWMKTPTLVSKCLLLLLSNISSMSLRKPALPISSFFFIYNMKITIVQSQMIVIQIKRHTLCRILSMVRGF